MAEPRPERKIIIIPAKKESPQEQAKKRNLRVAAYCRVSTGDEEQLTSYENQKAFYTEKIMKNPDWTMVDIFADESAIIGLSQNPVQTGGDLALFFLFSAQFSANEGVPA